MIISVNSKHFWVCLIVALFANTGVGAPVFSSASISVYSNAEANGGEEQDMSDTTSPYSATATSSGAGTFAYTKTDAQESYDSSNYEFHGAFTVQASGNSPGATAFCSIMSTMVIAIDMPSTLTITTKFITLDADSAYSLQLSNFFGSDSPIFVLSSEDNGSNFTQSYLLQPGQYVVDSSMYASAYALGSTASFNGTWDFGIQIVPEPSLLTLSAFGIIPFVKRRRKRRCWR